MTANAFSAVNAAILQSVVSLNLGLPCAYENIPFTKPKKEEAWAAVFVLSNQPAVATLGSVGQDSHTGILQIDLNYPLSKGVGPLLEKADNVYDYYKAGRRSVAANFEVIYQPCGRSRAREVAGWLKVTLSIPWETRVPRN
jgi:hypothetical protein